MKTHCLISTIILLSTVTALAGDAAPTLTEAAASYASADQQLNQTYQRARAAMSEDDFLELRSQQRHWITYRDFQCGQVLLRDLQAENREALKQTPQYWQRMTTLTRERTAILRAIIDARRGRPQPNAGLWIDGFGGYLRIVERETDLAFVINVTRGPTHHLGCIAGHAAINGRLIRFDDGGRTSPNGETQPPAWLTFIRRLDHMETISANTQDYCGARAYFDGDYYRVRALTEDEQTDVLSAAEQGGPIDP